MIHVCDFRRRRRKITCQTHDRSRTRHSRIRIFAGHAFAAQLLQWGRCAPRRQRPHRHRPAGQSDRKHCGSVPGNWRLRSWRYLHRQDPLHVIAHSMGGWTRDMRFGTCAGVAERVKTLVTIGTPHRGSPVADAVVAHTGPLFVQVPKPLVALLETNAGGLRDLTTTVAIQFDESTPERGRSAIHRSRGRCVKRQARRCGCSSSRR